MGLALELARVLKSYNMDKELRFIFFGAEERGLIGSRYYVSQLSDDDARRIVAVFQADMVATSYPNVTHLYAMTVDGAPNIVTEAATAAGARLGNSSILPGQFGSSDHVPFHNRGIPAALFIWMRVDSWDPLVYDIEKVYHTPQDTIAENISQERMQTALEIIGAAVFDLARKTVPAWIGLPIIARGLGRRPSQQLYARHTTRSPTSSSPRVRLILPSAIPRPTSTSRSCGTRSTAAPRSTVASQIPRH